MVGRGDWADSFLSLFLVCKCDVCRMSIVRNVRNKSGWKDELPNASAITRCGHEHDEMITDEVVN
jgi:hypothetical protein